METGSVTGGRSVHAAPLTLRETVTDAGSEPPAFVERVQDTAVPSALGWTTIPGVPGFPTPTPFRLTMTGLSSPPTVTIAVESPVARGAKARSSEQDPAGRTTVPG